MIAILKLFGFALSTIGWWERIRNRSSDISIYFVPSLTIALQVIVLLLWIERNYPDQIGSAVVFRGGNA